ncbi:hypothetical protein CCH79_00019910 [Gambusia affinis]|uniref:Ribonucleases P/MRP subunit Pop8-like domain-containing protein n=1 Tax=Gambusia affinis TaxID=33528 RepID=A0A315WCC7_GAMAF|nr:hypothetical protein CCH79_00019910 [Gambusia affinis]
MVPPSGPVQCQVLEILIRSSDVLVAWSYMLLRPDLLLGLEGVTPVCRVSSLQKMRAGAEEAESSGYQRVVLKNASPHHYLRVRLVLEDESTRVSAVDLKTFITSCLRSLFGEVGAALNVDVLKYDEETLTALLRVPSRYRSEAGSARRSWSWFGFSFLSSGFCFRGLVKLWSSLTLQGFYQNRACAFRVLQVSPFLLALTGNSRDLQLD